MTVSEQRGSEAAVMVTMMMMMVLLRLVSNIIHTLIKLMKR